MIPVMIMIIMPFEPKKVGRTFGKILGHAEAGISDLFENLLWFAVF